MYSTRHTHLCWQVRILLPQFLAQTQSSDVGLSMWFSEELDVFVGHRRKQILISFRTSRRATGQFSSRNRCRNLWPSENESECFCRRLDLLFGNHRHAKYFTRAKEISKYNGCVKVRLALWNKGRSSNVSMNILKNKMFWGDISFSFFS